MSIEMPLYAQAISGIKAALEEVAQDEAAINPALNFLISANRSRPYIEGVKNKALVNVLLFKVGTDPKSSSHNKIHRAVYHLDMYVRGTNSELTPPDEAAMERLHLLTAQVEYAITRMKNHRMGLAVGEISPEVETTLQYYPHEGEDSAGVYAPARFEMVCKFPYTVPDDAERTDLSRIDIELLEEWTVRFDYTS